MKYTFTFKEINYGSIEIEADHLPDTGEVTEAIMNGGAYIGDTEYEDILLDGENDLNKDEAETAKIETTQGYEIKRSVLFENNRGFAFAENPNAVSPFVTWQFTEENGNRDYYWGHYTSNGESAIMDYELRIAGYFHDNGISEKDAYRYYSTQRPVDIATYPKTENGPVRFENFDKREDVEQGKFKAWGYLVYDAPLTAKQIYDYELRPAPDNFDYVIEQNKKARTAPKPIMEQLAEAAKQVERGADAPAKNKDKSHEDR